MQKRVFGILLALCLMLSVCVFATETCEAHAYVAKADGTYVCGTCASTLTAPTDAVVIAAAPASVEEGTVSVKLSITTPENVTFSGSVFSVTAPEGFTLTGWTSEMDEPAVDEDGALTAAGWAVLGADPNEDTSYNLPYKLALLNLAVDENGDFTNGALTQADFVTLEFAVADTYAEDTAVVTVSVLETANIAEEQIASVAVSAEITAIEEPEVIVAYVGETPYATVQAAVDAVDVLGTVTVLDGVTETVTPAKTFYLAGDVDGITLAEASGYVLHSTTVDQYTGDVAVKNIVRPAEATYRQISSNTTLTYEAAIKMDFYALAGVMDEYADFYAVLTLNATEPRTYVITDKIGGTLQGNAAYKYTFPMIAAKEMGDTIDCTFFGIKADGTVEYRTRTSSVLDYCTGKLSDPAEATLMASILNYGAYAQTFFGYKTDAMVNANVPAELQAAYAETFENTVATKVNSRQDVEGITNLLAAQQTALNFEDSIQLNVQMLFNNADIANGVEDLTFVATFADETVEISGADWAMSDFNATQKMASLYITTIPAKQMRETVTYTLYRNYGTEDEVQVNGYRMVGIEEHITKAATSNTISEAEKILNRAILVYADAANAYFAK